MEPRSAESYVKAMSSTTVVKSNSELSSRKLLHSQCAESAYACDQCDATFGYPAQLRMHQTENHDPTPFKCTFCKKHFTKRPNLTRHIKDKHQISESNEIRIDLYEGTVRANVLKADDEPKCIREAVFVNSEAPDTEDTTAVVKNFYNRNSRPNLYDGNEWDTEESPEPDEVNSTFYNSHVAPRQAQHDNIHIKIEKTESYNEMIAAEPATNVQVGEQNLFHQTALRRNSQQETIPSVRWTMPHDFHIKQENIKKECIEPVSDEICDFQNGLKSDISVVIMQESNIKIEPLEETLNEVNNEDAEEAIGAIMPKESEVSNSFVLTEVTRHVRRDESVVIEQESNIKIEPLEETLNEMNYEGAEEDIGAIMPKESEVGKSFVLTRQSRRQHPLYVCKYCPRSYTTRNRLVKHMSSHKNDRDLPYKCDICAASFAYPFKLHEHRASHLDDAETTPTLSIPVRTFTKAKKRLGDNSTKTRN